MNSMYSNSSLDIFNNENILMRRHEADVNKDQFTHVHYQLLMGQIVPARKGLNLSDTDLFRIRIYIAFYIILTFLSVSILFVLNNWHLFTYHHHVHKSKHVDCTPYTIRRTVSVIIHTKQINDRKLQQLQQTTDRQLSKQSKSSRTIVMPTKCDASETNLLTVDSRIELN